MQMHCIGWLLSHHVARCVASTKLVVLILLYILFFVYIYIYFHIIHYIHVFSHMHRSIAGHGCCHGFISYSTSVLKVLQNLFKPLQTSAWYISLGLVWMAEGFSMLLKRWLGHCKENKHHWIRFFFVAQWCFLQTQCFVNDPSDCASSCSAGSCGSCCQNGWRACSNTEGRERANMSMSTVSVGSPLASVFVRLMNMGQ